MKYNPSIFKAYDIRGIYPKELNEKIAKYIGNAFAQINREHKIIVGRDMRLSSDKLFAGLVKGITMTGADVLSLGLVSTGVVYFASGLLNLPAVMITASHNPKNWNGFKFCFPGAVFLNKEKHLDKIAELVKAKKIMLEPIKGNLQQSNVIPLYVKKLHSLIKPKKIKKLKIVADAGNGMAGKIVPEIYKNLPCQITPLYFKLDGSFPEHQPNPLESKNTTALRRKIVQIKADFGMAFDGDADRVFFFDEKGKTISSSIIGSLVIDYLLKKKKKEKILYNTVCSDIVPETIKKHGTQAIQERVGHSIIKATMRRKNILFGVEHSGHFYYRDLFFIDCTMLTALLITQIVSGQNQPFSELIKPYQKYFKIEETNTAVKNKTTKIKQLERLYKDGRQSKLDGLTVRYKDWWFNVRPSNTEPVLRLNLEAKSEKLMKEKKKELLKIIRS